MSGRDLPAEMTISAPMLQLLGWLAGGPKPYDEMMSAWRSTCPRLSIWDDAVTDGLATVSRGSRLVTLTEIGRAVLDRAATKASAVPRR